MRSRIVILALCSAGCFTTTHHSASPPFVRSIASNADVLAVDNCAIARTERTHYDLFDSMFFHTNLSSSEVQLGNEACHVTFISLAPGAPAAKEPAR